MQQSPQDVDLEGDCQAQVKVNNKSHDMLFSKERQGSKHNNGLIEALKCIYLVIKLFIVNNEQTLLLSIHSFA